MQKELELARKEIRDIVREVREQPSKTTVLQSARQKLAERKQEISAEGAKIEKEESGAAVHDHSIRPGDPVRLSETTTVGEVEEIQGDNAVILCGNFRITTALKGLEKISRAQEKKLSKEQEHLQKKSTWSLHSSDDISTRLDLRGLTGEEAISEIGRFIDRLLLNRIFTATIIHGKGSGSLRQKTASFLQQHRHVKSFRLGDWSEGGAGVTIVELE
jgi:DNA mismatch repair protein MutS2